MKLYEIELTKPIAKIGVVIRTFLCNICQKDIQVYHDLPLEHFLFVALFDNAINAKITKVPNRIDL